MATMKLTKAQQEVMNHAKQNIDYARTHDFIHWIARHFTQLDLEKDWDAFPNPYLSNEIALQRAREAVENDKHPVMSNDIEIFPANHRRSAYEDEKNGITLCIASSNTLRALERMGLIEIITDAGRGVDHIRILNY